MRNGRERRPTQYTLLGEALAPAEIDPGVDVEVRALLSCPPYGLELKIRSREGTAQKWGSTDAFTS